MGHSNNRHAQLTTASKHLITCSICISSSMASGRFYAVARGREEGIFPTWEKTEPLVKGFPGAKHKWFSTWLEADAFLSANGSSAARGAEDTSGSNGNESASNHLTVHDDPDDNVEAPADESDDLLELSNLSIGEPAHIKTKAAQSALPAQEQKPEGATTLISGLWYHERAAFPDPQHKDALAAFCAGSAPRNGQPDCQGGYACLFPHHPDLNVTSRVENGPSTNNRADYLGALEAMKRANEQDPAHEQVLFIFSSNLVLIQSMTKWVYSWRANDWHKPNGEPAKNRDILEQLLDEQRGRRIMWRHVKAHTGLLDWESGLHEEASQAAQRFAN